MYNACVKIHSEIVSDQEKSLDNSFRVDSTFVLENFLVIAGFRGKRGPAAIFNKGTNNLQEFAINIL